MGEKREYGHMRYALDHEKIFKSAAATGRVYLHAAMLEAGMPLEAASGMCRRVSMADAIAHFLEVGCGKLMTGKVSGDLPEEMGGSRDFYDEQFAPLGDHAVLALDTSPFKEDKK